MYADQIILTEKNSQFTTQFFQLCFSTITDTEDNLRVIEEQNIKCLYVYVQILHNLGALPIYQ
jgi:hypothetical protein